MVDVVDPATRSRMMANIRAKNSRPEIFIRKGLHALGFRYRLHAKDIPGKPDIVLPKYSALILIQGCFWHAHNCHYFKLPATNPDFWKSKLDGNRQRDKRTLKQQLDAGWRCLVIWECAVRANQSEQKAPDVVALSAQWLAGKSSMAEIDEHGLHDRPLN